MASIPCVLGCSMKADNDTASSGEYLQPGLGRRFPGVIHNGRHAEPCNDDGCPCFVAGETAWREAVASVRASYPESIFPWPSDTVEGKVARMIRIACDEIERIATEADHG